MGWQCSRDGSFNNGSVCRVCGQAPYSFQPILSDDSIVIRISGRQRVIGADDWPVGPKREALSRFHMRVFFDPKKGEWNVANISSDGGLAINGFSLLLGQRALLRDGDVLVLTDRVSLRVGYETIG